MATHSFGTARLAILVLAGLAASAGAGYADFRHVRSDDPSVRRLVALGYERSATFRSLVDRIEASTGIVYVQPVAMLSRGMDAGLLHAVSGSPATPVLRVLIRRDLAGDYAIGVLAHELQHVAEALSRPAELFNSRAMTAVFRSLDIHGAVNGVFETDEARTMAARVLADSRREADQVSAIRRVRDSR